MSDKVLILRSTGPDRKSHGGFQWPESGYVEAPDWDPDPSVSCGNGLHGLLWGQGAIGMTSPGATDRVWQVVEVDPADIADVNAPDKVRFRCGTVLLSTADRVKAASLVAASAPAGIVVPFGSATAGYYGTATAGDCGTVCIKWWDGDRYRLVVGYVGEDGIEPNTPYRVVDGKLVAADEAVTA